jgi:hypothetical protein
LASLRFAHHIRREVILLGMVSGTSLPTLRKDHSGHLRTIQV